MVGPKGGTIAPSPLNTPLFVLYFYFYPLVLSFGQILDMFN